MQDREFAMAKSLLTVLSGRTRTTKGSVSSSSSTKTKPQTGFSAANAARAARRHRFDDKSGPPPPRGSLTDEKLSYLDWRLKRINNVRQKSEGTPHCWIDGRDTIGRNSVDIERSSRVELVQNHHHHQQQQNTQAPQAVVMMPSRVVAIYSDEKAAGLKALEHAFAGDSVLASLPYLAKRDSSSGSELSGSSGQHSSSSEAPPAAVLDAKSDRDVGGVYFIKPRKSLLTRAGSRFSKKKSVAEATNESRPASRNNRSIARIWNR